MSRPENLALKHWRIAEEVPFEIKQAMAHLHPVIIQVLYTRNIRQPSDMNAFLEHQYTASIDPFLLSDMDRLVSRITRAIDNDETVIVYGDFDADGVTATVLLVEALRGLGLSRKQAQPYIPDRVDEGYGLNKDALTALKEKGADLVISVDCGIRSIEEVNHANELGLDIIITDHHSLGAELPSAWAVINPKRQDSMYPERMLSGVGIAFKVAQALNQALPQANVNEKQLLDLVALGTVADLVPLRGENRLLVTQGLEVLNDCQRPGIDALAKVSGLKPGSITAESIAFALGPRINAAGRLAHAYDAARLLAVNNLRMARDYAQTLNQLNKKRQQLTNRLCDNAMAIVEPKAPILFAADPEFSSGVVGLVASRLAENFYRPAIVIEKGEKESRGSCRSIPEFHITHALDQVESLLIRHGGHSQAAGFTIKNENLAEFQEQMTAIASSEMDIEELRPQLDIDAELNIGDADWALVEVLGQLEPTGAANNKPLFASRGVQVYDHKAVGHDGSHLQLWVGDGSVKRQCIAFRQGAWAGYLPDRIDLAYTIGINEWNGRRELQLVVQDIRATAT